jgi:hypothetical protein
VIRDFETPQGHRLVAVVQQDRAATKLLVAQEVVEEQASARRPVDLHGSDRRGGQDLVDDVSQPDGGHCPAQKRVVVVCRDDDSDTGLAERPNRVANLVRYDVALATLPKSLEELGCRDMRRGSEGARRLLRGYVAAHPRVPQAAGLAELPVHGSEEVAPERVVAPVRPERGL